MTLTAHKTNSANALATCEIILFLNYFGLCPRPPEIILFSAWKLSINYFKIISQGIAAHEYFATCSM